MNFFSKEAHDGARGGSRLSLGFRHVGALRVSRRAGDVRFCLASRRNAFVAVAEFFWIAAAFTLVGFSPWFAYNITHEFWGLYRFSDAMARSSDTPWIIQVARRAFDLLTRDFAAGMHIRLGHAVLDKAVSYIL
ncbi:MAG: hypothetical protein M5R36_13720 [Deltaproteobacteria bacterium]|nr:hypothetical protein [Deltaproteobacteria bacterium]